MAEANARLLAAVRANGKMPAQERKRAQALLVNVAVSLTWFFLGHASCTAHLQACQNAEQGGGQGQLLVNGA